MKKNKLLISALSACLFLVAGAWAGVWLSFNQDVKAQQTSASIRTTIAVVNLDSGISSGQGVRNYADAVIADLGSDFTVVSASAAEKGYEAGTYGAVLTFPSNFSGNVLSINSSTPQQSTIEFKVNPQLPSETYLSLYTKLLTLQTEISRAVSYAYVEAIFSELHAAQNEASTLLQNDKEDMEAIEYVKLGDYVVMLDLGDIPKEEFKPEELVLDEFLAQAQSYAEAMSQEYIISYALAQADYELVEQSLTSSAQTITQSSVEWDASLREWASKMHQHQEELERYAGQAGAWEQEAAAWTASANVYREKTSEWINAVEDWSVSAESYVSDAVAYKNSIDAYLTQVNSYHSELDTWGMRSSTALDAMQYNQDAMEKYVQELSAWAQASGDAVAAYNANIQSLADYSEAWRQYALDFAAYVEDPENTPMPEEPDAELPELIDGSALESSDSVSKPMLKSVPDAGPLPAYAAPEIPAPAAFDSKAPARDPILDKPQSAAPAAPPVCQKITPAPNPKSRGSWTRLCSRSSWMQRLLRRKNT